MKKTRRSLITSLVTLLLCSAMFVGSTFAWFTDTVSNTGNRIQAGTLDVDLLMYKKNATDDNYSYQSIADTNGDIFKEATNANNSLETLWEPGKTQVVYLAVKNKGNLALKYQFYIDISDHGLCDDGQGNSSLEYVLVPGEDNAFALTDNYETVKTTATLSGATTGDVMPGRTVIANDGILDEISEKGEQNETEYFALIVHMKEDAGNAYQGKDAIIDVYLTATQYSSEKDGFGNPNYDAQADYEEKVPESKTDIVDKKIVEGENTIVISSTTLGEKDGTTTVTFPKEIKDFEGKQGKYTTMTLVATPTIAANQTFTISSEGAVGAIDLNVKIDGETVTEFKDKNGNPVLVKVETYIAKGLTNVSLSYNDTERWNQVENENYVDTLGELYYDITTGKLIYLTKHFSTFVLGADQEAYIESSNTAYNNLDEAITNSSADDTVFLLKDIDRTPNAKIAINKEKEVALDLNGHVLNLSADDEFRGGFIENNGKLTIKDSTDAKCDGTGKGKITTKATNPDQKPTPGYASNVITNKGNLTVLSGYIENTSIGTAGGAPASFAIDNLNNATLYIKGGKFYAKQCSAIRQYNQNNSSYNNVTISGGIFDSDSSLCYWLQDTDGGNSKTEITSGVFNKDVQLGHNGKHLNNEVLIKNVTIKGNLIVKYKYTSTKLENIIITGSFIEGDENYCEISNLKFTNHLYLKDMLKVYDYTKNVWLNGSTVGLEGYYALGESIEYDTGIDLNSKTITVYYCTMNDQKRRQIDSQYISKSGNIITINGVAIVALQNDEGLIGIYY